MSDPTFAAFNVTLEDSSPLIVYSPDGAWTDSPPNDPLLSNYSSNTFHTTTTPGATASFTFTGTGIWVYGALRQDHGHFNASIDGGPITTFNGFKQDPVTKFDLVRASGFKMGTHTIVLTNSPQAGDQTGFDIDFIIVQTELPTSDNPTTIDMDDTASSMQYQPAGAWTAQNGDNFVNKTAHVTTIAGASMSMNFSGEAVALYGSVSANHAPYTVTIDGESVSCRPSVSSLHTATTLFFTSGLSPGTHQLVVTNNAESPDQFLDIDYLQVFSSNTPSNSTSSVSSSSKAGLSGGAIGGIVIGIILLLALSIGAFVFFMKRQRRPAGAIKAMTVAQAAEKGELPIQEPPKRPERPPTLGDIRPARPGRTFTLLLSPTATVIPTKQFQGKLDNHE